ncbi:MAG: peptidoglycan-binding protein [Patescibacteria group bacterium]
MQRQKIIKLSNRWKLVFWLTLAMLLMFSVTPRGHAQSAFPYVKEFVISSYYTPLPGQAHYVTGSYEGDVRLNGEGVHSADGSLVYPGMAAAPKIYPFGTKMEIPGFGIVAVHDRGGAIKGSRLDIWVGSGEEGLRKALYWGMRTLPVTVYGIDESKKESVNIEGMPLANISEVPLSTNYFRADLSLGDDGDNVRELKRFLTKLGYLGDTHESPIYFGEDTKKALIRFQVEEKVIPNESDTGVGNFGPRSRATLESILARRKNSEINSLTQSTLKKGDTGDSVKSMQELLSQYGYAAEVSGNFTDNTFDALVRFQLDFGVITGKTQVGAGFYGPKTRTAFVDLITDAYTPENLFAPAKEESTVEQIKLTFMKELKFKDKGAEVATLQEELKRLHFLGLEPTGYFGKTTEHAVFKFQQAFNIVKDEKTPGSGLVGPKTMDALNDIVARRSSQKKLVIETTEKKEIITSRIEDEKSLVSGVMTPSAFGNDLIYGTRGGDIARLQAVLKRLGFFPGKITTEYFGDITKTSVVTFQKSHGLDESGNLDESTRKILNKIVAGA